MASWFEYAGVRSTDLGVIMAEPPPLILAAERVRLEQPPGRDGDVEFAEEALDPIPLPVQCIIRDESRVDEIGPWLRRRGWLRLGNRPHERYKARMVSQVDFNQIMRGRENRRFELLFDCQPYRYIYPEAPNIVIAKSGEAILNPGNAASEPRIWIEGSGEIVVTIGTQVMQFENVVGGVLVDTEFGDVFNLEATALENDKATMDDLPKIPTGKSILTWVGSVSKITIMPRWRNG